MKLLLVLGSDETHGLVALYTNPLGCELVRYNHVLKAMDNIDEIDPQAIIISARDFPRHWKTMVQFVRNERSEEACPIIVLKGDNFSREDASKASFLGVSGIVAEALDDSAEIDKFQDILRRRMPLGEKRKFHRFQVESWQRFGFVFVRPADYALITGEVIDVSSGGLSFLPDLPTLIREVTLNMELEDCSFRVGDSILSPDCRLARMGRIVSLEFLRFPGEEKEVLDNYLETILVRKLRNAGQEEAEPLPMWKT